MHLMYFINEITEIVELNIPMKLFKSQESS